MFIAANLVTLLTRDKINTNRLATILNIPMMTVRRLLTGETVDPRISTLKSLADYFKISLDSLINDNLSEIILEPKLSRAYLVPKISWENLPVLVEKSTISFADCDEWQSVSLNNNYNVSKRTFALASRPSMYPRFPRGTIFIIDPETTPADGDTVLVQIKNSNEFTLRELMIDPPSWRLAPLTTGSDMLDFSAEHHKLVGVSLLIMLYSSKLKNS